MLLVPWRELRHWEPERLAATIAERAGDAPVFLSFDIDFLEPGLAPGTGTPEAGGPRGDEVMAIVRGLAGIDMVGADVVEVAPQYDGPGQATAVMAANVLYEVLSLLALNRR